MPPSIAPTLLQLDFSRIFELTFIIVVFSFLLVDMFDNAGTLIGVTHRAGLLDKDGKLPRMKEALMADSFAAMFGSLIGTSTTTSYIESAAGVAAGGRTGLTAAFVAMFFLLALFFSPLAGMVPAYASAAALLYVACVMAQGLADMDWDDLTEYAPAVVTAVAMPLTYSIATGIGLGFITYVLCKLIAGKDHRGEARGDDSGADLRRQIRSRRMMDNAKSKVRRCHARSGSPALAPLAADAQAAELKVFGSRVTKVILGELGPQFEKATGFKPVVTADVAQVMKRRIEGGEAFDLAVLVDFQIDDLIKSGKLVADSRAEHHVVGHRRRGEARRAEARHQHGRGVQADAAERQVDHVSQGRREHHPPAQAVRPARHHRGDQGQGGRNARASRCRNSSPKARSSSA